MQIKGIKVEWTQTFEHHCKCQDCVNAIADSDSDEENGVYDDFSEYLASDTVMDDV